MDMFKKIGQDLKNGWEKLDRTKRIRLGLVVFAFIFFVSVTAWWIQKPNYAVLFSDLDPVDAGQIAEDLETQGMDYELSDGGTTILIDQQYIDKYRIDLAVGGMLPENSIGFEIFDTTSMMATDEDREIMYQRAIQGELERAIGALDAVESAKVMLSIPEDSVFQNPEYQKEATASVVLNTKGSNTLSTQSITGIASLVSGAVDQLPVSNIQIIDKNGNLLSKQLQDDQVAYGADIVSQRQAIQREYEFNMEQKILSLLGPIYGIDKIQVSVYAELNFDSEELESTSYANNGEGSVVSEQESVSGNSGLVQGVQGGTLDDNAGAVIEEGDDGNNSYDRTTNYELDSIQQKRITAPGTPTNLTASVVIKGYPIETVDEMELIETTLGGIGTASVHYVPDGDNTPSLIPSNGEFTQKLWNTVQSYWMFIVGVLLAIILLVVFMRRRRKKADLEDWETFDEEDHSFNGEADMNVVSKTQEEWEEKERLEEKQADVQKKNEKEEATRDYVKTNPDVASEMIKIWMNEKKV